MNIFALLGYFVALILTAIALDGIHPTFYMYANFPSLLLIFAFFLLTLLGTRSGKDFINGIKIGFRSKKSYSMMELKKADKTLDMCIHSLLYAGIIIFLMSIISVLYRMSLSTIGPCIAMGLVSLLYALIFILFLTVFKMRIHLLIIAYAEEDLSKDAKLNEEALEQRIYYLLRSKGLTDREAEVARLISQELSNRDIANRLFITEGTVKKHVTHILEKLQLEGREAIMEFIHNDGEFSPVS